MDNEELTTLLREWVEATVAISENVKVIAQVLVRAEDKLEENK